METGSKANTLKKPVTWRLRTLSDLRHLQVLNCRNLASLATPAHQWGLHDSNVHDIGRMKGVGSILTKTIIRIGLYSWL